MYTPKKVRHAGFASLSCNRSLTVATPRCLVYAASEQPRRYARSSTVLIVGLRQVIFPNLMACWVEEAKKGNTNLTSRPPVSRSPHESATAIGRLHEPSLPMANHIFPLPWSRDMKAVYIPSGVEGEEAVQNSLVKELGCPVGKIAKFKTPRYSRWVY